MVSRTPRKAVKGGVAAPKAKKPRKKATQQTVAAEPRNGAIWDDRFVGIATKLVDRGATDEDIAEALGCDMEELAWWREEHPAFDKAFHRDPRGAGRPTIWDDKFVEVAKAMAKLGAIDMDIANALGCNIRTLHRWKIEHPEFADALEVGKELADTIVEQSLFRRATGYTYDSEKIVTAGGVVQRVETMEHVPPDTTAAIFWLKNRKGVDWRDTKNLKHDVDEKSPLGSFLSKLGPSTFTPIEDAPDDDAPNSIRPSDDEDGEGEDA
ncbi:hypothetical protein [Agrobacterium tumefaciens]|uniref:hypothetical protein n=1 Tax=Agrobacterium tumefaciens TaxID=358 RepID=UPI0021D33CE1|nr:hypothetical protein [Agrobacterium tumefaciens]UXS01109.1 hypothetical protein FY156_06185 [Agrobacterium tumefaciens]